MGCLENTACVVQKEMYAGRQPACFAPNNVKQIPPLESDVTSVVENMSTVWDISAL